MHYSTSFPEINTLTILCIGFNESMTLSTWSNAVVASMHSLIRDLTQFTCTWFLPEDIHVWCGEGHWKKQGGGTEKKRWSLWPRQLWGGTPGSYSCKWSLINVCNQTTVIWYIYTENLSACLTCSYRSLGQFWQQLWGDPWKSVMVSVQLGVKPVKIQETVWSITVNFQRDITLAF